MSTTSSSASSRLRRKSSARSSTVPPIKRLPSVRIARKQIPPVFPKDPDSPAGTPDCPAKRSSTSAQPLLIGSHFASAQASTCVIGQDDNTSPIPKPASGAEGVERATSTKLTDKRAVQKYVITTVKACLSVAVLQHLLSVPFQAPITSTAPDQVLDDANAPAKSTIKSEPDSPVRKLEVRRLPSRPSGCRVHCVTRTGSSKGKGRAEESSSSMSRNDSRSSRTGQNHSNHFQSNQSQGGSTAGEGALTTTKRRRFKGKCARLWCCPHPDCLGRRSAVSELIRELARDKDHPIPICQRCWTAYSQDEDGTEAWIEHDRIRRNKKRPDLWCEERCICRRHDVNLSNGVVAPHLPINGCYETMADKYLFLLQFTDPSWPVKPQAEDEEECNHTRQGTRARKTSGSNTTNATAGPSANPSTSPRTSDADDAGQNTNMFHEQWQALCQAQHQELLQLRNEVSQLRNRLRVEQTAHAQEAQRGRDLEQRLLAGAMWGTGPNPELRQHGQPGPSAVHSQQIQPDLIAARTTFPINNDTVRIELTPASYSVPTAAEEHVLESMGGLFAELVPMDVDGDWIQSLTDEQLTEIFSDSGAYSQGGSFAFDSSLGDSSQR